MKNGGYIILQKALLTHPEFLKLCMRLERAHALAPRDAESAALGYLAKLWLLADSHIRADDTLDLSAYDVDVFLGVEGISQILGSNWLEILDADQVRLPNWLAHNGATPKKQARSAARQDKHRTKVRNATALQGVTPERDSGDAEAPPPIPSHPIPSQPYLRTPPTPSPATGEGAQTAKKRYGKRAKNLEQLAALVTGLAKPTTT